MEGEQKRERQGRDSEEGVNKKKRREKSNEKMKKNKINKTKKQTYQKNKIKCRMLPSIPPNLNYTQKKKKTKKKNTKQKTKKKKKKKNEWVPEEGYHPSGLGTLDSN